MASAFETLLLADYSALIANTPQLSNSLFVSVTTASVSFAIPSGYNNIEVVWRVRASDAVTSEQLYLQLNGDTNNDYVWEACQANNTGSVVGATGGTAVAHIQVGTVPGASATANYAGSGRFTISGASDSTPKTVSGHAFAATGVSNAYSGTYGGLWSGTAAVTTVGLACASGSFAVNSRFSVYVFN